MGTLTESLKDCRVRKEPYKILVDRISGLPEENDGVSNDESQDIDGKNRQDISMHGVTVSEKGRRFCITNFAHYLSFLFIYWPFHTEN